MLRAEGVENKVVKKRQSTSDLANNVTSSINMLVGKEKEERVYVSTGSTMLNLALTGDPYKGFRLGTINNIVGDSSSGKTILVWSVWAEALINHYLDKYDIEYDDAESAFTFDESLFGSNTSRIIRSCSRYVQDFNVNLLKKLQSGKSFLYGLDSFDSLTSYEEEERSKELVKSGKQGGSYKTEKPMHLSAILRETRDLIKEQKSLLLVVSQTRDNIGVTFGDKKTRSGGRALRFYSYHELWMAVKKHLKRKDRDVGVETVIKVRKNKETGRVRIISFPIYFDYGIDDTGSMIDFLIEEKVWKKDGHSFDTGSDFGKISEKDLIEETVRKEGREKLVGIVKGVWDEIESEISTDRPAKYF